MKIVDTNVIAYALEGMEPYASELQRAVERDQVATNVVVRYEVLIASRRTAKAEQKALDIMNVAPCRILDRTAHERALEIGKELERKGKRIPTPDVFIAAMALLHGDSVMTVDEHFTRVDGLAVELLPPPRRTA